MLNLHIIKKYTKLGLLPEWHGSKRGMRYYIYRIIKNSVSLKATAEKEHVNYSGLNKKFFGQLTHSLIVDIDGLEDSNPPSVFRGALLTTHPVGLPPIQYKYYNNMQQRYITQCISKEVVEFSKEQIEIQNPFKNVTGTKEDFFLENPKDLEVVQSASFLYKLLTKTNDRGFLATEPVLKSDKLREVCKYTYNNGLDLIIWIKEQDPVLDLIIHSMVTNIPVNPTLASHLKSEKIQLAVDEAIRRKKLIEERFRREIQGEDPEEVELVEQGINRSRRAHEYDHSSGIFLKMINNARLAILQNHPKMDPNKPMYFIQPILSREIVAVMEASRNADISDLLK